MPNFGFFGFFSSQDHPGVEESSISFVNVSAGCKRILLGGCQCGTAEVLAWLRLWLCHAKVPVRPQHRLPALFGWRRRGSQPGGLIKSNF